MRYFLEISYLGTAYHGWQIQPKENSIQAEIEHALSNILSQEIRIHGSSRTDTGVHARQQYAHFDLGGTEPILKDLKWKLNSFLPKDISINNVFECNEQQHSRFDAINRKYIYRINLSKNPFFLEQSYYFRKELDIMSMNKASLLLLNNTNFQCFSKVKTEVNNFNCNIDLAEWQKNEDILEFHIRANRFLRGMVRAIVGTLIEVGQNRVSINEFQQIIDSKNRSNAGSAAKAHGLTLEEVNYPQSYFNL